MCMYIPPWFAGLNQLDGIGRIGPPDPDASWYHKNGSNEELSTREREDANAVRDIVRIARASARVMARQGIEMFIQAGSMPDPNDGAAILGGWAKGVICVMTTAIAPAFSAF
mmetsp:Transcript_94019/g.140879  ORF Transcript_94019/g.140879 Transcript_94019/m.140879 type:complete len:112 (-) Transcript_94019:446-781(-)